MKRIEKWEEIFDPQFDLEGPVVEVIERLSGLVKTHGYNLRLNHSYDSIALEKLVVESDEDFEKRKKRYEQRLRKQLENLETKKETIKKELHENI